MSALSTGHWHAGGGQYRALWEARGTGPGGNNMHKIVKHQQKEKEVCFSKCLRNFLFPKSFNRTK